ncbi:hypothetical protein RFI_20204 [Reticulomyxa filosa]|uniref:Uncharacterized protein n=1 Tax=Reticulomyxa filosa TaxID=46433 RepID=X6MTE8_RETFI|nr:hypothetical protein RFI_20204 [Reticulomyxa filosa]|eukprot:ETO17129.1 hypothetical protein RFI_20204 [Reticulomyxa filosa]
MSLLQEQVGNEAKDDELSEITNRNEVLQKIEDISQRLKFCMYKKKCRCKTILENYCEHSRVSQDLAVEDETSLKQQIMMLQKQVELLTKYQDIDNKYVSKIEESAPYAVPILNERPYVGQATIVNDLHLEKFDQNATTLALESLNRFRNIFDRNRDNFPRWRRNFWLGKTHTNYRIVFVYSTYYRNACQLKFKR